MFRYYSRHKFCSLWLIREIIFIMNMLSHTRIGIISDTHGYLDPRIAEVIEGCDLGIHAGDIMGHHILKQMQPRSGDVIAVRGNNDNESVWSPEEHAALKPLDHVASIKLQGGTLVVIHGHLHGGNHPKHSIMRHQFPDARAIVYGHTHVMTCDKESMPWVINPGASGQVRTHGGPSCLILEVSNDDWKIESIRFEDDAA